MAKNFLVGIGGSGARVAEAAVFLCAAGFGPEKLNLFLIDPDKGNGNLGRTTRLISKYLECRKAFFDPNGQSTLFRPAIIVPEDEKDRIWGIFTKTDTTLGEWIGYDGLKETQRAEYDMMSILFSKDELSTRLNEGFRGHPAIGSVVMSELPQDEYPFKLLWDEMTDSKAFDVRLFLVGSVFGGTGAAGFPTLGHRNSIKFNKSRNTVINETESISRVLLGGALILPYFKVVKNGDTSGMFVTSNDFPIATKAALEFYDTKESLGFDQIYFIGDSLSHNVGDFSVGSTSQENKPHYVEIVSALATFDFFNQESIEPGKNEPKYFIARREGEKVSWNSFPFSRQEEKIAFVQNDFKEALVTMTIFCYSLVTYGRKILDPANDAGYNKAEVFKQPWYKDHFINDKNDEFINLRTSTNKDALNKAIDFAEEFLEWIISISEYTNVELLDSGKLRKGPKEWTNPINTSFIGELLTESSKKRGWSDLDGFLAALNSPEIKDKLKQNAKSLSAANKFINLFFEAANKFAKSNYTIN